MSRPFTSFKLKKRKLVRAGPLYLYQNEDTKEYKYGPVIPDKEEKWMVIAEFNAHKNA